MKNVLLIVGMFALMTATAGAMVHQVTITGFAFDPATLTIAPGDSVTWTNQDAANHTATADDFAWTTAVLSTGDSETVVFSDEGVEPYHCGVHPSMTADLEVTATGIGDDLPRPDGPKTHLASARPNPFNPHTLLPFAIAEAGHVRLVIYDGTGRHVRSLMDGVLAAGSHHAVFDGNNDRGKSLPSGRYVAHLSAGGTEVTTPLLLVR